MRVRDIVRRSFEQLVAAGTLPPYGRQGRYVPPPPRHNAPWRPEQLEILHHGAAAGTLYADPAAWESAVAFIRSFTAAAARPDVMPWSIDSFCGSFGEVPADDLLHHLTAGLSGCGLHAIGTNTIARTAHFEATDTATVGALPEPYGKWFQIRERRPRWKEPVALRLMVRIHARIALRPDGRLPVPSARPERSASLPLRSAHEAAPIGDRKSVV